MLEKREDGVFFNQDGVQLELQGPRGTSESVPQPSKSSIIRQGIQLYYITHVDNIRSIAQHGVLSHEEVNNRGIKFTPIYDESIVESRKNKSTPDKKSLWKYANLYFQPRNAMLYRVSIEKSIDQIAIVTVDSRSVINGPGVMITTGNAAHHLTEIIPTTPRKRIGEAFSKFREAIQLDFWREDDGTKRMMMAECLVPDRVPPEAITTIYTPGQETADQARASLNSAGRGTISVIPNPHMFFEPSLRQQLTPNLTILAGDMFFSRMQTLTVSVNTVGIMGKGVASRAKYQFPDVYVEYQRACRNKKLRMGRPYLYKREKSLDYELADDPTTLNEANNQTWFLLFATKNHFSERASKQGIERGLNWIRDNCEGEGIKSLAVPALGAGLGRLDWADIGPVICQNLAALDIEVEVYLPAERAIPREQLSRDFLLSKKVSSDRTL
ncbi:MAG TPA: DarT ssDNA thymidine ADP-ribosyltransferase family protein [Candidatus Bathyarchaeia archaeon]|nr:DarT ssDNA thymidine ADP-ribosyltransferase family protein [Candidatus Bathyarchaeia archaeon]